MSVGRTPSAVADSTAAVWDTTLAVAAGDTDLAAVAGDTDLAAAGRVVENCPAAWSRKQP